MGILFHMVGKIDMVQFCYNFVTPLHLAVIDDELFARNTKMNHFEMTYFLLMHIRKHMFSNKKTGKNGLSKGKVKHIVNAKCGMVGSYCNGVPHRYIDKATAAALCASFKCKAYIQMIEMFLTLVHANMNLHYKISKDFLRPWKVSKSKKKKYKGPDISKIVPWNTHKLTLFENFRKNCKKEIEIAAKNYGVTDLLTLSILFEFIPGQDPIEIGCKLYDQYSEREMHMYVKKKRRYKYDSKVILWPF